MDFKKIVCENIESLSYDGNLDLIKACIKLLNPDFGFEMTIESEMGPGSGLGGLCSSILISYRSFKSYSK